MVLYFFSFAFFGFLGGVGLLGSGSVLLVPLGNVRGMRCPLFHVVQLTRLSPYFEPPVLDGLVLLIDHSGAVMGVPRNVAGTGSTVWSGVDSSARMGRRRQLLSN